MASNIISELFYFMCIVWMIQSNITVVHADIFTSIGKMKEIFFHEKRLLSGIKMALKGIDATHETGIILRFCHAREEQIKHENFKESAVNIKHPNVVYAMIKHFADTYKDVRPAIQKTAIPYMQSTLQDIPSGHDLHGAAMSLLRLQEVYGLDPVDMSNGDYQGHLGPPLNALDAFNIGLAAYEDNKYHLSSQWFDVAHAKLLGNKTIKIPSMEQVVSLLSQSRAFEETQDIGTVTEPKDAKLSSLLRALNTNCSQQYTKHILDAEMKRVHGLCAKMDHRYPKMDHRLVCRYKPMLLAYNRMEEEILSLSPYVSLIYNITRPRETIAVQKIASRQLFRAQVQEEEGSNLSDFRTSHVAFLGESDSKHLASLTRRISHLTNLECLSNPNGHQLHQSAGEKYQIVNYGIGGHYSVHMDTYEASYSGSQDTLKNSGNRIATVLIYLSRVESGGSTVFPWLDIAIKPLQYSALVWYNIDTSGTVDFRTRHAGCPVLVGDKWVMNKWILSHANTFRRPCTLGNTSNQQRLEKIVKG